MKKILAIIAFLAATLAVEAQQVRTFYYKNESYWVKLDLNKKTLLYDGCGSESDPITNYKKVGAKETFTTNNGLTMHHEFVKKTDTDYTYSYWTDPKEKGSIEVTTKKENNAAVAVDDKDSKVESKNQNPVKKTTNSVKGLFNKGKNLFKKDKKAQSQTTKSSHNNEHRVDDGLPEK